MRVFEPLEVIRRWDSAKSITERIKILKHLVDNYRKSNKNKGKINYKFMDDDFQNTGTLFLQRLTKSVFRSLENCQENNIIYLVQELLKMILLFLRLRASYLQDFWKFNGVDLIIVVLDLPSRKNSNNIDYCMQIILESARKRMVIDNYLLQKLCKVIIQTDNVLLLQRYESILKSLQQPLDYDTLCNKLIAGCSKTGQKICGIRVLCYCWYKDRNGLLKDFPQLQVIVPSLVRLAVSSPADYQYDCAILMARIICDTTNMTCRDAVLRSICAMLVCGDTLNSSVAAAWAQLPESDRTSSSSQSSFIIACNAIDHIITSLTNNHHRFDPNNGRGISSLAENLIQSDVLQTLIYMLFSEIVVVYRSRVGDTGIMDDEEYNLINGIDGNENLLNDATSYLSEKGSHISIAATYLKGLYREVEVIPFPENNDTYGHDHGHSIRVPEMAMNWTATTYSKSQGVGLGPGMAMELVGDSFANRFSSSYDYVKDSNDQNNNNMTLISAPVSEGESFLIKANQALQRIYGDQTRVLAIVGLLQGLCQTPKLEECIINLTPAPLAKAAAALDRDCDDQGMKRPFSVAAALMSVTDYKEARENVSLSLETLIRHVKVEFQKGVEIEEQAEKELSIEMQDILLKHEQKKLEQRLRRTSSSPVKGEEEKGNDNDNDLNTNLSVGQRLSMSVNTGMHMFPKEEKMNEMESELDDGVDMGTAAAEEEFNNLMLSVSVSVSQSQVNVVPMVDLTDLGDGVDVQQSASRHADIVRPSPNKGKTTKNRTYTHQIRRNENNTSPTEPMFDITQTQSPTQPLSPGERNPWNSTFNSNYSPRLNFTRNVVVSSPRSPRRSQPSPKVLSQQIEQQLLLGSTKALVQSRLHDICDALARDAIANVLILEERNEEMKKNKVKTK